MWPSWTSRAYRYTHPSDLRWMSAEDIVQLPLSEVDPRLSLQDAETELQRDDKLRALNDLMTRVHFYRRLSPSEKTMYHTTNQDAIRVFFENERSRSQDDDASVESGVAPHSRRYSVQPPPRSMHHMYARHTVPSMMASAASIRAGTPTPSSRSRRTGGRRHLRQQAWSTPARLPIHRGARTRRRAGGRSAPARRRRRGHTRRPHRVVKSTRRNRRH